MLSLLLRFFLTGLAATVLIGAIAFSVKWLVDYIKRRIKENKGRKIVFTKLEDVLSDAFKEEIKKSKTIPLEELERMCAETPYVSAVYDEEAGTVKGYEGFQVKSEEAQFIQKMKENDGMIVIGG